MNILQKITACNNWAECEDLKDEARQACQMKALQQRRFDLFRLGMAGPHLPSTHGVDVERLTSAIGVAMIPVIIALRIQPQDITAEHLTLAAAGLPVARLLGMIPYRKEMPRIDEVSFLLRERYIATKASGELGKDAMVDQDTSDWPAFMRDWALTARGLLMDYLGDDTVLDQLVAHTVKPLAALDAILN